jgi:preprotein translocase subunit SecA
MFEELRGNIAREVSNYIFRLERVEQQVAPKMIAPAQTLKGDFSVFSNNEPQRQAVPMPVQNSSQSQLITNRASTAPVQAVRSAFQVGRNDLCPCGSGKKFKKCHGSV